MKLKTYSLVKMTLAFLAVLFSCQYNSNRNQKVTHDNEGKNKLQILLYVTSLDYSLSMDGNVLKIIDQHLEATVTKELFVHNDTVAKIQSMASEIIYTPPPEVTHLSKDAEIKIFLDNELIYHDPIFGRGGDEKVEALVDYILECLDYKIYIFNYPPKQKDGTYQW